MKRFSLLDFIVFLFIVLFVYAATSKLITFDLFKIQIQTAPLLMRFSQIIAYAIPVMEIIISVMLIVPRLTLYGFYASFFLMFLFAAYIVFILTVSPNVPCSCGGVLENLGWTEHLVFNMFFVLLAVLGIVLHNRNRKSFSIR